MSDVIRVGVNGAGGRMGRRIVALTHADAALEVTAAIDAESSGLVGRQGLHTRHARLGSQTVIVISTEL